MFTLTSADVKLLPVDKIIIVDGVEVRRVQDYVYFTFLGLDYCSKFPDYQLSDEEIIKTARRTMKVMTPCKNHGLTLKDFANFSEYMNHVRLNCK